MTKARRSLLRALEEILQSSPFIRTKSFTKYDDQHILVLSRTSAEQRSLGMTRPRIRLTVTIHDLVEGIMCMAALRRRYFAPTRDRARDSSLAFDLSMWQAYEWLEYAYEQMGRSDEIPFRIRPHEMHGDSPAVQEAVAGLLGYAFRTWVPGNGVFECRLDESQLRRALERNTIPQELLMELAERFIREYEWSRTKRTWPPNFSLE